MGIEKKEKFGITLIIGHLESCPHISKSSDNLASEFH